MPQPPKAVLSPKEREAQAIKEAEATRIAVQKINKQEKEFQKFKKAKDLARLIAAKEGKQNVHAPRNAERMNREKNNEAAILDILKYGPTIDHNNIINSAIKYKK